MGFGGSSPGTTSTLDGRQKRVENVLASNIIPNINQGAPSYTGQQVAPLDQGYQSIYQSLGQYNPSQQNAQAQQGIQAGLSGQASYTPNQQYAATPQLDPNQTAAYFQQSTATPALRNYQQNIAPQIDAAYAGQGATFSSRRGLAQQQALQNMNSDLTSQLASSQNQNYLANYQANVNAAQQQNTLGYQYGALNASLADSAAQRQQTAVGQSQAQSLLPLQQQSALQSLYSPYQTQAQNQATSQYNEFLRTQPYNSPYTAQALSLLGQNTLGLFNQQTPGALQQIQGAAAAGGSILGAGAGAVGLGSSLAGLLGGGSTAAAASSVTPELLAALALI